MNQEEINDYKKAGEIAKKVKEYARSIIKKDTLLLEIAEKIESEIIELGAKPAFPVNLSINEIAAHYTPSFDDKTLACGLLKVDFGAHINGCIVDVAFSLDLENNEENKKLILASEKALASAIEIVKKEKNKEVWKIGKTIQEEITAFNFSPIRNLSGHALGEFRIHAGLTIPNTNNGNETRLEEGAYAIEPFATTGIGSVYEGGKSGIYSLQERKAVRTMEARKILDFIEEEYKTLPFCSRWLVKQFGTKALFSLSLLEKEGILHHYPQLIEKGKGKVSQAENTILINKEKVEVLG